jgi:hypothetical protein
MSIAVELCSDVVTAVLERNSNNPDRDRLKHILLEVHSTLRHLTINSRRMQPKANINLLSMPHNKSSVRS